MRNTVWLRVLFGFVLVQALLLVRALIWPDLIAQNLPWPASPLNARFIAALYAMGAVTSVLAMLARCYAAIRIPLVLLGVLTGGLLALTLPHLGEFTAATFPYRWIAFYTADVIVVAVVLWQLRGRDTRPAGTNPMGLVLLGYAALLAVVGIAMLVAPDWAVHLWPWRLTPILAQVYSIFFLTFALGGVLSARDPRFQAVWIYLSANLATVLLVIGVSLGYPHRFTPGAPTAVWYLLWGGSAIALAAALGEGLRRRPAAARKVAA
jgi:hypothetical protein